MTSEQKQAKLEVLEEAIIRICPMCKEEARSGKGTRRGSREKVYHIRAGRGVAKERANCPATPLHLMMFELGLQETETGGVLTTSGQDQAKLEVLKEGIVRMCPTCREDARSGKSTLQRSMERRYHMLADNKVADCPASPLHLMTDEISRQETD